MNQASRPAANSYAYEARRRAHQLRRDGWSYRRIAGELGVALAQVQKYVREPVRERGVLPNVRNLQEVWTHLSFAHSGHWARNTSSAGVNRGVHDDLFETDDTPPCICGWALNCRHIRTGKVHVWKRSPDMDGAAKTRMLWTCPVHNPELTTEQVNHIGVVAPPSIFCYRFETYSHADSARRAAYRLDKRGEDGSYILLSRRDWTGLCWDMASSTNLTRRVASARRARTTEVETQEVLPLLGQGLAHLSTLRAVGARYQWQPPAPMLDINNPERTEVEYETITSGVFRTIYEIAPTVIKRQIGPRDVVSEDEWHALARYLKRTH